MEHNYELRQFCGGELRPLDRYYQTQGEYKMPSAHTHTHTHTHTHILHFPHYYYYYYYYDRHHHINLEREIQIDR